MELSRVLPPTQTTKRGERAHVHGGFIDVVEEGEEEGEEKSRTKKKESASSRCFFAIAYVNEKSGKAYVRRVANGDDDDGVVDVVCEHAHRKITCVRPFIATTKEGESKKSFLLCASGSADGSVHVWCSKTGALRRRHERVLAGPIRDIAWSFDGSKLAVVGEGKEVSSSSSFARCINAEMGTTVKDLGGATKACGTACASRSGKPHRVVTGSDDFRVRFYKGGPPFQLETIATMTTTTTNDSEEEQRQKHKRRQQNHRRHEKYVNEVRMSEDDKYVLSAAGDGIGVWDVETLEMIGDDGRVAAKDGSTYGVAWLDDKEHRFVSSGADKMVKLWNVKDVAREREVGVDVELEILTAAATATTEGETKRDGEEEAKIRLVVKPKMGRYVTKQVTREDAYSCCRTKTTTTTTTAAKPSVDDMQIGVCASAKTVVSCGLSGTMTVFDVVDDDDNDDEKKEGEKKRLRFREEILGHSRPITAMCSVDVSSSSMKKYQIWTASIQREDDPRPRILVCDYIPEKKTIENVEEVKENTPLKKITKLVNCGDTYVAAIGFDDHLRFASVANKAFTDDGGEECRVKFERQPIDVCVVSVSSASFSPPPSTGEEKEGEEEPRGPTVTKVQCELLVTFADARAQLVPIEYEKSSTEGGAGGLKILFDRIQRIDVTSTNSTTKRKKEVELSCGCAVHFFESGNDEATTTTTTKTTKTLFAFGAANEAAVHIFERRNVDGIIERKQTLERSNASSCNITCLDFAPNGKHLAVGDSNREIILYTSDKLHQSMGVEEEEEEEEGEKFRLLKPRDRRHSKFLHGSRVEDVSWSRSSTSLLSCSLDGHAKIWRNVIVQNTTDSEDSVPKIESVDVNAVDGGARFARLLHVGVDDDDDDFDEKSKEESNDDLDTARAHLVCAGADCAVRFFSPASSSQKRI